MKRFTVPIMRTTMGWISIEAETLEQARAEVLTLTEASVASFLIQDPASESEVFIDELEEAS